MHKSTILSLLGIVSGLGLLASSFYWTSPLGPQPTWTEEQARELQQAGAAYHRQKLHPHPHRNSDADHPTADSHPTADGEREQVRKARQRWERQDVKFQAVQSQHRQVAQTLRWSGIALATLGVVGLLLGRPQSQ